MMAELRYGELLRPLTVLAFVAAGCRIIFLVTNMLLMGEPVYTPTARPCGRLNFYLIATLQLLN